MVKKKMHKICTKSEDDEYVQWLFEFAKRDLLFRLVFLYTEIHSTAGKEADREKQNGGKATVACFFTEDSVCKVKLC